MKEQKYVEYFPAAVRDRALATAHEIRKFEIDLYWKRAGYFWTFIGAAFVAFGVAQQLPNPETKTDLSVIASCLGVVFSWAWFLINKGSKYWQNAWEKHVDMLEDEFTGPLYKIHWYSSEIDGSWVRRLGHSSKRFVLEANQSSVTRINQLVSLFITAIWICLLVHVIPIELTRAINWWYVAVIAMTTIFCCIIFFFGGSGRINPLTEFTIRGVTGGVERKASDVPPPDFV